MDLPPLPLLLVPDTLASAPLRGALLIGFMVALFGAAIGAVKVGQRKRANQSASDLSALTGTGDGAHRGGDGSVSSDWWNAAITEDEHLAPTQTWQSAFLDQEEEPVAASAVVGEPGYARSFDVSAMVADASSPYAGMTEPVLPAALTVAANEPALAEAAPVAVAEDEAAEGDSSQADPSQALPESPDDVIAWSDTESDIEPSAWSTPLGDLGTFDAPSALPVEELVPEAPGGDVLGDPAPVAAGVTDPVRTDITYVPDPQALPTPYALSAPTVAEMAAVAIYDDPSPVVPAAPVEQVSPEPSFDVPTFAPAVVALDAPISLAPSAAMSADNSWGADETGDDDGISPTWWQQAIADDK